jgi:hypothetical protein
MPSAAHCPWAAPRQGPSIGLIIVTTLPAYRAEGQVAVRQKAWLCARNWSGRRESNPRHTAWEAVVLPLNYARALQQIDARFRELNRNCRVCSKRFLVRKLSQTVTSNFKHLQGVTESPRDMNATWTRQHFRSRTGRAQLQRARSHHRSAETDDRKYLRSS